MNKLKLYIYACYMCTIWTWLNMLPLPESLVHFFFSPQRWDELGMHQPSWDIEASVWPKKLRNLCLKSDAADDVKSLVEPRLHGVFVQETKRGVDLFLFLCCVKCNLVVLWGKGCRAVYWWVVVVLLWTTTAD